MSDSRTADELAIRDLVARYADAVVRRDESAWGDTWAEKGEWTVMGRTATGREQVVELWNTLMATLPFVIQLPHSAMLSIDGDRATGRWYITEHGQRADGAGMQMFGVYHDEYGKEDGRWRFIRRRFDPLYAGAPDLSSQPLPFPAEFNERPPE